MSPLLHRLQRLLARCALPLALAAAAPAQAEAVSYFVPYAGQGNVAVFDAAAGTGGWVGSIDQVAPPPVASPLSLVSVVLFTVDAAALTFSGSFEFTTTDLLNTLFGELSGTVSSADILDSGGQFAIDYRILGGTGLFAGAGGFGLAFVDYNPMGIAANGDTYLESGLLSFSVPEPATLALVALALAAALSLRASARKVRRVN